MFWTPLSAYCKLQIFPDSLGQRLSSIILSKEVCISLKKKHVSFSHHSMNDIHWHDSWYLLTAQRFFSHIHDNLIASVLLCVDSIIWSFILNSSSYKDHVVLQFQFCPLWQRAAPVYSRSAGRDSPRQPTIFLQCHIFSGSSHICLYKFLFVNIEVFFFMKVQGEKYLSTFCE